MTGRKCGFAGVRSGPGPVELEGYIFGREYSERGAGPGLGDKEEDGGYEDSFNEDVNKE